MIIAMTGLTGGLKPNTSLSVCGGGLGGRGGLGGGCGGFGGGRGDGGGEGGEGGGDGLGGVGSSDVGSPLLPSQPTMVKSGLGGVSSALHQTETV